jgi:hypothetical protein
MSPISKETSSERAALNPSLQPQPHRGHRHKKFHVRPAAYGEGYESFALLQSSSSRPPGSPAPPSIPGAKAIVENAPAPTTASLISKWEAVSEKEISGRAARNALRISLQVLTLLILLVLFCRYSDWPWRFLIWVRQFPLLTH